MEGINNEGYIYRNMWSTIILFVPFSIYYIVKKVKPLNYNIIFICGTIIYTILLFVLYKTNNISSYYYYKIYYLIWPIIIYISTLGIIEFYNKKTLNKIIAIILITIYIIIMFAFIKNITYYFKGSYTSKDKEGFTTIMGIFNINRTLLEMPKLINIEEMNCLEYVENNIDPEKTLFIIIPRQEDWKQILLYNKVPHNTNFTNINEEIEKWNNGEYENIVLFINRNTYKVNNEKINLTNAEKIYSNNETQIWRNIKR